MSFQQISHCRTCESESLTLCLDLGQQPLANALRSIPQTQNEPRFPLRLVHCGNCGLIQIDVNVEPQLMFSSYNWVTGTSQVSINHCREFVEKSTQKLGRRPNSVLEIGSNDGTLLREYEKKGIGKLVGVDPARNLTLDYGEKIRSENMFFSSTNAELLLNRYGKFDIIVARNVFSHVPDFIDVMSGISCLLSNESVFFMEFHWAYDILAGLHYDSIYHEHTYYHSISSVSRVFERFGIKIFDGFKSPISGGSVVLASSPSICNATDEVHSMTELESEAGIDETESWVQFGMRSLENVAEVRNIITSFSEKKICGFGASARSSTILNVIGKDAGKIISIGDNNARKWGSFTPGFGIPIESVSEMLSRKPDLIIIFPFNFKEEIMRQLSGMGWSGHVLFPIPHPPTLLRI